MTVRFASLLLLAATASVAHADEVYPEPAPPLPVYYPTPMQQTVQTTYVPQSVALSGPEEIDAEEGRRAPAGYTPVQRTRKGMLIGGSVTLGVGYFYSVLVAAAGEDLGSGGSYDDNGNYYDDDKNELAAMWIPVAGPFIQMTQTDSSMANVFLGLLGGAQVVGAVMLYKGLTTTKTVYVRNDLVSDISVAPMVGNGNTGVALGGRF